MVVQINKSLGNEKTEITLQTSSEGNVYKYFIPVKGDKFRFKVKSSGHVHLHLTNVSWHTQGAPEIFFGCPGSTILRHSQNMAVYYSDDIVHPEEFREFWISWANGKYAAGTAVDGDEPFISWIDPNPHPVTYIGIITAWSNHGVWKIPDVDPRTVKEKLTDSKSMSPSRCTTEEPLPKLDPSFVLSEPEYNQVLGANEAQDIDASDIKLSTLDRQPPPPKFYVDDD